MRRDIAITVGACLAAVAMVVTLFVFSVVRDKPLSDQQLADLGAVLLPTPRELYPAKLVDQHGVRFDLKRLTGHWTLMFFGYTSCPDICPATMAKLGQARRMADTAKGGHKSFDVVMVSVDPERDTPAKLGDYVSYFGSDFIGLTGTREAIARFGAALNVAFGKIPGDTAGGYLVDHTVNVIIIDPRGHYHGFLKPPHDANNIAKVMAAMAKRWPP